jgi:hypothetical protein
MRVLLKEYYRQIVLEAKWREPENLAKIAKTTDDGYREGDNLAWLKQNVGKSLRRNQETSSPITKRVDKIAAAAEEERRAEGLRNKANELGTHPNDDDTQSAWRKEEFDRKNTHAKLLKRYGQKQSSNLEDDKIGDRLYRGQITGGDPWKDGTYGGAFHYGHPVKKDTRTYSGAPTTGANVGDLIRNLEPASPIGRELHVTHHYKNHPNQLYGRPFQPEDVVTRRSAYRRKSESEDLRNLPAGSVGNRLEAPIMKQYNPFVGTELSDTHGDRSYFFPAGKPAQAAQNYAREMSKTITSKGDKIEAINYRKPDLNIQPQNLSGVGNQPERLKKLEKESPEKFAEFMRRRAEKYLSPRQQKNDF